ncbi:VOC family protein [Pseudomonas xantholysinigenes]|uniref:VOC family protein n=1 Tax=Pseudomonas xantholysinigenes TaxID=2745490 RepID=A0A9E6Q040_9PSED|nr:VOC family protein [Pseudomonas xantholysinigenes]QXI40319.1 VOC family protein [Pseudomonas xantholysinigenes]
MQLKFSHVDVLVDHLETACAYYQQVLGAEISTTQVWDRGGLRVRYAVARLGQERFMLVQPSAGNLRTLLDQHGEGMIYRHCYSTPDIEQAYDELLARGVQPEDENGQPLARADLQSPAGARILWLPKRFGHFSIEILEEQSIERFIEAAFNPGS